MTKAETEKNKLELSNESEVGSELSIEMLKSQEKKVLFKVLLTMFLTLIFISIIFIIYENNIRDVFGAAKPVIYLYPEKVQDIYVSLDYKGDLLADYPDYDKSIKGWKVRAYPSGKLINHADKKEYSYLFWEGNPYKKVDWDLSTGFVIAKKDLKKFLQKTLKEIGLTPKEYNEFIVYWYPIMMKNKYSLIHFADKQYLETAPLTISPKPDSLLRVFMVVKALDKKIKIKKQVIKAFKRTGFTVVEWGGTNLN